MARSYAALPHDYLEEMELLSDEEFGRLIRALLVYSKTGETSELSGSERVLFPRVKLQEDRFQESYNASLEQKQEAGRKGGKARAEKRKQRLAGESTGEQSQAEPGTEQETQAVLSGDKQEEASSSGAKRDLAALSDASRNQATPGGAKQNQAPPSDVRRSQAALSVAKQSLADPSESSNNNNKNKTNTPDTIVSGVSKKRQSRFYAPAREDVAAYCAERGNSVDPDRFIDYYAAQGWKLSNGVKMKDWRAAVRNWERRESCDTSGGQYSNRGSPTDVYMQIAQEEGCL